MNAATAFAARPLRSSDAMEPAARHAVIIRAGNMSLGVNLLVQLTKKVAQALDEDFDIEVIEAHHNQKVDAPSGTALMLGEAAAEGRGVALMAAGDHLVVTYAGRDQLTNAQLPPAVPIAELYDTLREMIGDDGVAAIENGARMACDTGVLAGYPLVDLKITLKDSAMLEGETTEADFAYAASEAIWNGARDAGPSLLEPVMEVEVVVPVRSAVAEKIPETVPVF